MPTWEAQRTEASFSLHKQPTDMEEFWAVVSFIFTQTLLSCCLWAYHGIYAQYSPSAVLLKMIQQSNMPCDYLTDISPYNIRPHSLMEIILCFILFSEATSMIMLSAGKSQSLSSSQWIMRNTLYFHTEDWYLVKSGKTNSIVKRFGYVGNNCCLLWPDFRNPNSTLDPGTWTNLKTRVAQIDRRISLFIYRTLPR